MKSTIEPGDPAPAPTELQPNTLWQTPNNEVVKVSEVYHENQVSASVVYPMPPRTTVRFYSAEDVAQWRVPSDQILARYEIAWGYR